MWQSLRGSETPGGEDQEKALEEENRAMKCIRSWVKGGHCWHFVAHVIVEVACTASGTKCYDTSKSKYECCLCKQVELREPPSK